MEDITTLLGALTPRASRHQNYFQVGKFPLFASQIFNRSKRKKATRLEVRS